MGRERKREKKRNREREKRGRERRNVVHTTNRGVCLRATDLTIFWLVSEVASGRKASDGLTRVEQIYEQNKKKAADSNNCNFAADQGNVYLHVHKNMASQSIGHTPVTRSYLGT